MPSISRVADAFTNTVLGPCAKQPLTIIPAPAGFLLGAASLEGVRPATWR